MLPDLTVPASETPDLTVFDLDTLVVPVVFGLFVGVIVLWLVDRVGFGGISPLATGMLELRLI